MALEPVVWSAHADAGGAVVAAREGRGLAPFRLLGQDDAATPVIGARAAIETRTLATSLAGPADAAEGEPAPGIVHRRYGKGQVLSIGLDGLWRWSLNAKADGRPTLYDRFWDQLVLWLLAGRDFMPEHEFSLRSNAANILLGDKVYFRVVTREPHPELAHVPVRIYADDREAAAIDLAADASGHAPTGAWLPESTGKYRAVAAFPDGSSGENRFIVYEENAEQTDVAVDELYLRRLCESSGGRLLQPGELADVLATRDDAGPGAVSKTVRVSVWDRTWFFYTIGAVLAAEWFLRRRWGLC
jgi:hypothetical protein